jgi:hypothetical protein
MGANTSRRPYPIFSRKRTSQLAWHRSASGHQATLALDDAAYAYNGSIVVRIDIGVSSPRNICSPSGRQGPGVAPAKGAVTSSG